MYVLWNRTYFRNFLIIAFKSIPHTEKVTHVVWWHRKLCANYHGKIINTLSNSVTVMAKLFRTAKCWIRYGFIPRNRFFFEKGMYWMKIKWLLNTQIGNTTVNTFNQIIYINCYFATTNNGYFPSRHAGKYMYFCKTWRKKMIRFVNNLFCYKLISLFFGFKDRTF